MKVLFLLPGLELGGSEKKSVRLVNELAKRGRDVRLAYLKEPAPLRGAIDSAVPVTHLRRRGKFSFRALKLLRSVITEQRTSVVLCVNLYPLLYAMALKLFFRSTFKVIVAINITDFERLRDRFAILLYAVLIRRSDAVIYGCEYQKKLWEERYRLHNSHALVIYNGVDTEFFDRERRRGDLREQLGIGNRFVLGTVGRMDPEKGQANLLRAVARLARDEAGLEVLLAGAGPQREALERLAEELGIVEQVHFLGRLEDVRPLLSTLDVFVLPSMAVETFSNASLEAMAMAVPVILSKIGGAAEMVRDGENGFLYDKHDLSALTKLLRKVRVDPGMRERMGVRARDLVLERFDIHQMIDKYDELFKSVGGNLRRA